MRSSPLILFAKNALVFTVCVIVGYELVHWVRQWLGFSQIVEKGVAGVVAVMFFTAWSRRHRRAQEETSSEANP